MRVVVVLLAWLAASIARAETGARADEGARPAEGPGAPIDPAAEETAPDAETPPLRPVSDALAPKIAVVVVGDPDAAAQILLEALDAALRTSSAVRLPTDAALVQALAGGGQDDGLDDVRRERRSLGLSERRDLPVLVRLGRLAAATAVLIVRPAARDFELVVLDVGREAFFDGALALPASAGDILRFAERRAIAAADAAVSPSVARAGADAGEPTPPTDPAATRDAAGRDAETGDAETGDAGTGDAETGDAETGDAPSDPVLVWFEQNWAYLAAGVLLAGGAVFVGVVAADPGDGPPMLRFTPGAR